MTDKDRSISLCGINEGKSFREIAEEIGKSQTTVSREILKHRYPERKGVHETLITDLDDYTVQKLKDMYGMRWGVEVEYLTLKSRLQLENFTGKTENSVKQDFWATLLADLMISVHEDEAKPEIDRRKKDCAYEYKTNRNVVIGVIKKYASIAFLSPSQRERKRAMSKMQEAAKKFVCPIKPGRQTQRAKNKHKTKYSFNNKSNC